jgi:hypothetical protein
MTRRIALWWAQLNAMSLLAIHSQHAAAGGDSAKLDLSLSFREGAECGTVAGLSERLKARSERLEVRASALRRVQVTSAGAGHVWRAQVDLQLPGELAVHRELEAQSCDALLDAVAFVIVVSLEQREDDSGVPPASAEGPASGAGPEGAAQGDGQGGKGQRGSGQAESSQPSRAQGASAPPTTHATTTPANAPAPSRLPNSSSFDEPELVADRSSPTATTWNSSLGPVLAWTHGAAPSELWGGGAFFRVQRRGPSYRPFLRVSVGLFPERNWTTADGVASFGLLAGTLEACPLALATGPFETGLGLVLVAGRLSAAGERAHEPERHNRPWAFAGLGLSSVLEVQPLQLGLGVRAGPTLAQDEFQFAPQVFYGVPGWGAQADIGLGLMLP